MSDRVVNLFDSGRHQPRLAEKEVTVPKLQEALELAVFSTKIDDDGDIYVSDGFDFPFWISIDDSSKMIRFYTYWKNEEISNDQINLANWTYKAVQFSRNDKRVIASYYMSCHGGLDTRQMIVMARHYGNICRTVFDEFEPKKPDACIND